MARDPLVDPHKGDVVRFLNDQEEVALVLEVARDNTEDPDPDFGPDTVYARIDNKWGSRRGSTIALETWRNCAKNGEVCWHA